MTLKIGGHSPRGLIRPTDWATPPDFLTAIHATKEVNHVRSPSASDRVWQAACISMRPFTIDAAQQGRTYVIRIKGELDLDQCPASIVHWKSPSRVELAVSCSTSRS